MIFEFATATQIIFGTGSLAQIGTLAREFGAKPLVVTGANPTRHAVLTALLQASGFAPTHFVVSGEPSVETVREGVACAKERDCDFVIGFGGGSVLDAGKAIAALATNEGDPLDFLEVVGAGKPLKNPPLPYIAIPTTAGTGAEVTRNAVLSVPEQGVKVSLRSPKMLPKIALVDPELTYDLPPALTASTGLDALTQVLEPYVSNRANAITDILCREGLKRAGRSLMSAFLDGKNVQAREDMAFASLCGGMALANARLGAVHGFAAPLGGQFPAPHGAVCACLLPHCTEINIRALRSRAPNSPALERYREVACILTGSTSATAEEGAKWLSELVQSLEVPSLSSYGVAKADIEAQCKKAEKASSMQGNPIVLLPEELHEILERAR